MMARFARFGTIRLSGRQGGKQIAVRRMIRELLEKYRTDPRSESFIGRSVEELMRSNLIDHELARVIRHADSFGFGIAIIHTGLGDMEAGASSWEAVAIATELIPTGMLYHFPHQYAYQSYINRAQESER